MYVVFFALILPSMELLWFVNLFDYALGNMKDIKDILNGGFHLLATLPFSNIAAKVTCQLTS